MITVVPFKDLGRFENDWLDAHYHFSFADYRDPGRMGLGPLRVWNDDTIRPHSGFAPHPHRDMEIITYVRTGAISHTDNLGNRGVTRAGDVQVMSAGTGIEHAEMNDEDEATTLFQIWIQTDRRGHEPRWDARRFPDQAVTGTLPVLASGRDGHGDALMIHQDAALLGGRVEAGTEIAHVFAAGRGGYLVPITGAIEINGVPAGPRDGVQITREGSITIRASEDTEVMLVDVAADG